MCRLRTNFDRLGDPLQGLHNGNAPLLPPAAASSPEGGDLLCAYPCDAYETIAYLRFYSSL
jgi:hypothetical protein